jgi:hypothetical protein
VVIMVRLCLTTMGSVLWNQGCLSCNLWRLTSLQTLLTLALPPCHSRTSVVRLLTFRDHPNRASPSFSTGAIRTTYPLTSITTLSCTRPAGGTRSRLGFRCTRPAAGCGVSCRLWGQRCRWCDNPTIRGRFRPSSTTTSSCSQRGTRPTFHPSSLRSRPAVQRSGFCPP